MTRWSLLLQTLCLLHHFLGLYSRFFPNADTYRYSHPISNTHSYSSGYARTYTYRYSNANSDSSATDMRILRL